MRESLLVVDDEKHIRNVLQRSFENLGYTVYAASGGKEGEVLARRIRPRCIILDVMMPDKNGHTVCLNLKRDPATAAIPIILLTAKRLPDDIYWGYDCGADAYVTKPYEPKELEALVAQLITETSQGTRSIAWTGLPARAKVIEEASARLNTGGEVFLAEISFPDEPKKVFIQKYGNAKFRDLIHSLAWMIYKVVRENASAGLVGQGADESFIVLMPPSEAARLEAQIQKATTPVIDGYYHPQERAAQAIVYWQHAPVGTEGDVRKEVPLLRLQWKPREAARH